VLVARRSFKKLVQCRFGVNGTEIEKGQGLAHREGRTRSLQIRVVMRPCTHRKSLTLYPIELGGHFQMNRIRATRPVNTLTRLKRQNLYMHISVRCTSRTLFVFVIDESNVRG
jgi:hypothetical protein